MTPESTMQAIGGGLMAALAVGVGIEKVRAWLAVVTPAPRETSLPPAPSQPSLHECAGCATLRVEVSSIKGEATKIMLTLARMEGEKDARREERAARRKGDVRESNG